MDKSQRELINTYFRKRKIANEQGSYYNYYEAIYCLENNIEIQDFNGTIEYDFDGNVHKYFPDFYLKECDLVVEVKSKWTYECELEQNECKKVGSLEKGYNFMFIIDKNYNEFETYINEKRTTL